MAHEELLEMRATVVGPLIELTLYDLSNGRLVYRFMPGRGGPVSS